MSVWADFQFSEKEVNLSVTLKTVTANLWHACHRWHIIIFKLAHQASGPGENCVRSPCSHAAFEALKITWAFSHGFMRLQNTHESKALLRSFQKVQWGESRGEENSLRRYREISFVQGRGCMWHTSKVKVDIFWIFDNAEPKRSTKSLQVVLNLQPFV